MVDFLSSVNLYPLYLKKNIYNNKKKCFWEMLNRSTCVNRCTETKNMNIFIKQIYKQKIITSHFWVFIPNIAPMYEDFLSLLAFLNSYLIFCKKLDENIPFISKQVIVWLLCDTVNWFIIILNWRLGLSTVHCSGFTALVNST